MNYLDLIIAVFLILGFILGYKDGLIRKLIGLAGFLAAIYLAVVLSEALGRVIENVFDIEFYLSEIMAGVFVFLTVILIFSIIKRLVHPHDKVNNFINQLLGGIVGTLQMLFFISAMLYLLDMFDFPSKKETNSSLLYSAVYQVVPSTINLIGGYSEPKEIIKEYIIEKDTLK